MDIARRLFPLLFIPFLACGGEMIISVDGRTQDDDDDDGTTEDLTRWEDATLTILSPEAGGIYISGEEVLFDVEIKNPEGEVLEFPDISWTSSIDEAWSLEGDGITTMDLMIGLQDFTASCELPNEDRLSHTVADVLVQNLYTGIYEGDVIIDSVVEIYGRPYETTCTGDFYMEVDIYGEEVWGEAVCAGDIEDYYYYEIPLDISGLHTEGEMEGDVTFDFWGYYSYTVPFTGLIDGDFTAWGEFEAWGSSFSMNGGFVAMRVGIDLTD